MCLPKYLPYRINDSDMHFALASKAIRYIESLRQILEVYHQMSRLGWLPLFLYHFHFPYWYAYFYIISLQVMNTEIGIKFFLDFLTAKQYWKSHCNRNVWQKHYNASTFVSLDLSQFYHQHFNFTEIFSDTNMNWYDRGAVIRPNTCALQYRPFPYYTDSTGTHHNH